MDKQEAKRALDVVLAIAETIREAGEIPSGHMYAALCGAVDMAGYQGAVRVLKNAGLVVVTGHLLRWVGPKVGAS